MRTEDVTKTLKPVLGGAVGGILVATVAAFSFNWIYTAGTLNEQVHQARVSSLAQICESNAEHYWTDEQGMKMAKLEGWGNDQRAKLANRFAPEVPNDSAYHEDVVDACGEALQPA